MNSFPLNFTNSKQTLGTSTTDTIKTVNLFSPEQPNEIEIEPDMAEGNLSKSSEWPMTTLNHQGPQQLPLQNESQPKLVEAQDHLSPYFSNDSKIRVSGADDKSGDCTKSQLSNVNSVQSIEVADQSSGSTKIAAGHRKLREIGMYDAHLVEKEFESLIHQLNLKRQHDAETFQQFCKSLRIKVLLDLSTLLQHQVLSLLIRLRQCNNFHQLCL